MARLSLSELAASEDAEQEPDAYAMHLPTVPAKLALLVLAYAERGRELAEVARRTGINIRMLTGIKAQERGHYSFDTVDTLITRGIGDPGLWHSHRELRRIMHSPPVFTVIGRCPNCKRQSYLTDYEHALLCSQCARGVMQP